MTNATTAPSHSKAIYLPIISIAVTRCAIWTVEQFCRFAPLVAGLGARVILEVPKPLVSLLASLPGVSLVLLALDAGAGR